MDNNIKNFLLKNLNNPTIIEAGTASGYDTEWFCENFTGGKIYGFEPIPQLFEKAIERTKNYNNVIINNNALSNTNDIIEMYISDMSGDIVESSSILKPKDHLTYHPNITFKQKINVQSIRLDDFIKSKNINIVNLLWLDLQGFESLVLKDSPDTMSRTQFIFTEINMIEVYENTMLWSEFEPFMVSKGFEKIWDDLQPNVDAANAFFINKNLLKIN
jgi:FkbM family methyltransferase